MADEGNFAASLGGTKDGVTVSGSVTGNQDILGDVIYSDTLALTTTATYEAIDWPPALQAEGICGLLLIPDPNNEAEVVVSATNADAGAFACLIVGGIPVLIRPFLDAAAGNPAIFVKSAWTTVAAKVHIVALGAEV